MTLRIPCQTASLHQLHREVVLAVVAADFVDGHDVGVVQVGGGLGLLAKAGHIGRAGELTAQDHLERHNAIERDLPRPVHDAHAAAGDLLQKLIIAEVANGRARAGAARATGTNGFQVGQLLLDRPGQSLHGVAVGEEGAQVGGQIGMLLDEPGAVGRGSRLDGVEVVGQDPFESLVAFGDGRGFGHGDSPPACSAIE